LLLQGNSRQRRVGEKLLDDEARARTRSTGTSSLGMLGSLTARHQAPIAPGESRAFSFSVGVSAAHREGYLSCEVATDGDLNRQNDRYAIQGGTPT
jgi:hypothetical protein